MLVIKRTAYGIFIVIILIDEKEKYFIEIRESYLRISLDEQNDMLSFYYIHALTGEK